jgi:hypothetical protein
MVSKYNDLTTNDFQVIDSLINIVGICANGLKKPYDHTSFITKMKDLGLKDSMILQQCCPPSADVHDSKDLKPYIMGALDEIFDILKIEKKRRNE